MKKLLVSVLISASLVSCGPGGGQFTTKNVVVPVHATQEQSKPTILQDGGYQIVHGATSTSDMKVVYNSDLKAYALQGTLTVAPLNENQTLSVAVDMTGLPDSQGFIYLSSKDTAPALPDGVELGAKATCLGENLDCSSSFIDIYVIYKSKVYHHQLESQAPAKASEAAQQPRQQQADDDQQEDQPLPPPQVQPSTPPQQAAGVPKVVNPPQQPVGAPQVANPPSAPQKPSVKPTTPAPAPGTLAPSKSNDDDNDGNIEETPETDGTPSLPGRYVGDFAKDIDKIIATDKTKAVSKTKTPPVTNPKPAPTKTEPAPKPNPQTPPVKQDTTPSTPSPGAAPVAPSPSVDSLVFQSIGPADSGRLENASNLLDYANTHNPTGFHIISPTRKTYFANRETVAMITFIGQYTLKYVPNNIVSIGDMTFEHGGPLGFYTKKNGKTVFSGHLSHTNGVDSDISFYFSDRSKQGRLQTALKPDGSVDPDWMINDQWALFKKLVDTKTIDRMFIHKTLKMALCDLAEKNGELRKGDTTSEAAETLRRLVPNKDHYNHFHMRLKCASEQHRCQQMVDPAPGSGCF